LTASFKTAKQDNQEDTSPKRVGFFNSLLFIRGRRAAVIYFLSGALVEGVLVSAPKSMEAELMQ
jgi:hypothetical protein